MALVVEAGSTRWVVVVPVKGRGAKSRLDVPGVDRARLAEAMAADAITAVLATPGVEAVVVVGSAPPDVPGQPGPAVHVVVDPGGGLNPAIEAGLAAARSGWPSVGLAVLLADLPALRPGQLARALELAAAWPGPSLVADTAGVGTVLLASPTGALVPAFGEGSRARHAAVATDLTGPLTRAGAQVAGLRRDVDTAADLDAARQLGLGPRTAALLQSAVVAGEPAGRG